MFESKRRVSEPHLPPTRGPANPRHQSVRLTAFGQRRAVAQVQAGASVAQVAAAVGVSRQTLYTWLRRAAAATPEWGDRSSRPQRSPTRLPRHRRRQIEKARWSAASARDAPRRVLAIRRYRAPFTSERSLVLDVHRCAGNRMHDGEALGVQQQPAIVAGGGSLVGAIAEDRRVKSLRMRRVHLQLMRTPGVRDELYARSPPPSVPITRHSVCAGLPCTGSWMLRGRSSTSTRNGSVSWPCSPRTAPSSTAT